MIDGAHSRIIAEIQAEEAREASGSQMGIERFIRFVGRPSLAFCIAALLAIWLVAGFPWLTLTISLFSLTITVLILIAENRQSMISERRAQVALQIALVSEEKIAKIIELLERLRRDAPGVPNHHDEEATRMSEATDLRAAFDEMDQAEEQAAIQPQS